MVLLVLFVLLSCVVFGGRGSVLVQERPERLVEGGRLLDVGQMRGVFQHHQLGADDLAVDDLGMLDRRARVVLADEDQGRRPDARQETMVVDPYGLRYRLRGLCFDGTALTR